MTKIAFTSCCLYGHDHDQDTWTRIAEQRPDRLILMGDSIYMDYAATLYSGKRMTPEEFGQTMQEKYMRQFTHPAFNNFIRGAHHPAPTIMAIWDDHDFAWNNCYGGDPVHEHRVPEPKKKISRHLFTTFRNACRNRLREWPVQDIKAVLEAPYNPNGIEESEDLAVGGWRVRIITLDGRYHRRAISGGNGTLADLLGTVQATNFRRKVLGNGTAGSKADLVIVVSGTTLESGGESWDNTFRAGKRELLEMARVHGAMIVLSGDVHEIEFKPQIDGNPHCAEVTASGVSLRNIPIIGLLRQNFGILELTENRAARVTLYNRSRWPHAAGGGTLQYPAPGLSLESVSPDEVPEAPGLLEFQPVIPDEADPAAPGIAPVEPDVKG